MFENRLTLSLWVLIPCAVALIAVSIETGYRIGRWMRRRPDHEPDQLASDLATPTVGLLGLMLAFTFGWSATRFDARRNTRLDEAKALARLFRLADFLPPQDRDQTRRIIHEYITISLTATDAAAFDASFARREAMHEALWRMAVAAGRADPSSDVAAQLTAAANDVFDTHLVRAALAASSRLPRSIFDGLIAILVLTTSMIGYQMGLAGSARSPALIPLTIAIALVIFLIVDLDRPLEGLLRVRDQALVEVQRELKDWR